MRTLNLDTLTDIRALTKARNAAMKSAHPDKGGTDAQARAIIEAFERLRERLPR